MCRERGEKTNVLAPGGVDSLKKLDFISRPQGATIDEISERLEVKRMV